MYKMTNVYKVIHFSIIIAEDWKQCVCSLVRNRFNCIHPQYTITFKKRGKPWTVRASTCTSGDIFNSWLGCMQEATDQCFSLSFSVLSSKINKILKSKKRKDCCVMTSSDLQDIVNEKRVQNSIYSMLKRNENVYYICLSIQ